MDIHTRLPLGIRMVISLTIFMCTSVKDATDILHILLLKFLFYFWRLCLSCKLAYLKWFYFRFVPLRKHRLNLGITVYQPSSLTPAKIIFADLKGKVSFAFMSFMVTSGYSELPRHISFLKRRLYVWNSICSDYFRHWTCLCYKAICFQLFDHCEKVCWTQNSKSEDLII